MFRIPRIFGPFAVSAIVQFDLELAYSIFARELIYSCKRNEVTFCIPIV